MIVRRLARPMLAAIFITGGIDALRKPEPKADAAQPGLDQAVNALPASVTDRLPDSPETIVQINAAVQIGAGALFALGKAPRLSALALAGTLVPTTLAGHDFWNAEDPATRAQQRVHFIKNIGLLGGLMIAAVDTEGKPSLGWRGRRAAARGRQAVAAAVPLAAAESRNSETLHNVAERVRTLTGEAGEQGGHLIEIAKERAPELAETARERGETLLGIARERGPALAERARDKSAEYLDRAREHGPELVEAAKERAPEYADVARKRGAKLWDTTVDRGTEWAHLAEDRSSALNAKALAAAEKAKARAELARAKTAKAEKKLQKKQKELEKKK